MNQFILALCGLPASGKSKLADAIQKALESEVVIVRTDDWRDDTYYTNWKPEKEKSVREAALDRVREQVSEGKSVIHDDTNYYTSMRHELFEIAVENGIGFSIIHVSTTVTTALQWNRERPNSDIPESVIENISERFDIPGKRYLWDNSDLEVDMEADDLSAVIPEIITILEEISPAREPKPMLVTSNEFDKLDTVTRQVVSEFLKENPGLRGKRQVSVIRREFLRTAIERRMPLKGVKQVLLERLNKLL